MSKKTELIEEYVRKYAVQLQEAEIGKKQLARMIVDAHADIFNGEYDREVDNVRSIIRGFTGAKDRVNNIIINAPNPNHGKAVKASQIPKSIAKDMGERFVKMPAGRGGILNDIHIPYHDENALTIALDYLEDSEIDWLYLNGDIIDFFDISRWGKPTDGPKVWEEFEMLQAFLAHLRERFPEIPIYYKLGNHEDRWEHYFWNKAKELDGMFKFADVAKLDDYNVQLVKSAEIARVGKMLLIHGHEFGHSIFSPVNPARGLFLRAGTSVAAGHYHQVSTHSESDLQGNPKSCFSMGCLCNLSPDYRPFAFTKWRHGFALVDVEDTGNFTFRNYTIINGIVRT